MSTEGNASIGIIGGGNGGLEIIKILTRCNLMRIDFVVDLNPVAPGILYAQERKIPTYTDMYQALQENTVDYLIETTGSAKVLSLLGEITDGSVEIISSKSALLFFRIIDEKVSSSLRTKESISGILTRATASLSDIQKSLNAINVISLDLDMLAINARIESAHAEVHGKGFAVVADEVRNSSRAVQDLSGEISRFNDEIVTITREIEESLFSCVD